MGYIQIQYVSIIKIGINNESSSQLEPSREKRGSEKIGCFGVQVGFFKDTTKLKIKWGSSES